MRLLVVDDHVLFRQGLITLLNTQPQITVVGEAGSVSEAIQQAHDLQPELILMDYSLGDGTGLDATHAILALHPETKIVFLTVHEEDQSLFAAVRCGAAGYLLKNTPITDLISYLHGVYNGEAAISPAMAGRILTEFSRLSQQTHSHQPDYVDLTERELDVLHELIRGATNQEIAVQLSVSVNTVKNHVRSILSKLQLKNRREAVNYAQSHGFIPYRQKYNSQFGH